MQYESPVVKEVGSVRELTLQNDWAKIVDSKGLFNDHKGGGDPVGS